MEKSTLDQTLDMQEIYALEFIRDMEEKTNMLVDNRKLKKGMTPIARKLAEKDYLTRSEVHRGKILESVYYSINIKGIEALKFKDTAHNHQNATEVMYHPV